MKLMVLIVAYNAAKTIETLLNRIPKSLWESATEIVVADDCSPADNTAEVATEYKKKNRLQNLTIFRHNKNKGYGGNQKWGYNYAINKGYDVVVMLHGDVQYAPEYTPMLVDWLVKNDYAFVFGSRMAGEPLKGGMPLYKFLGNKFLTAVENVVLGKKLTEYHSGFRVYSTKALNKIPFNLCSNDFHFDSEIIVQLCLAKQRIGELPISTHYGNEKCYVNVISYGLNILKTLGEYGLTKTRVKVYPKYDLKNFYKF